MCLLSVPKVTAQGTEAERLVQKGIDEYNDLEFENAIQLLERALNLGLPDKPKVEAYKYLGFAYIVKERIPKAKEMFKQLLEIDPNHQLSPHASPKLSQVFNEVKSQFKPSVKTGSISVESTPEGASIYLDGELQDVKTPTTLKNVKLGEHTVKLFLEGYEDFEKSVTVQANQTAEVISTLTEIEKSRAQVEPVKKAGAIFVESEPAGANIYLDEALQESKTPATIGDVAPGAHSLKLSKLNYQEWTRQIDVEAGKTNKLSAKLFPITQEPEAPKPLTPAKRSSRKWWIIGGGAVVAAAATGLVIALTGGDETTSLEITIELP